MSGKKEKKKDFIDDGRVIADMNVEGFRWYRPKRGKMGSTDKKEEFEDLKLTRKEKRAMMFAAYKTLLPVLAAFGILMALVVVLLSFWLK